VPTDVYGQAGTAERAGHPVAQYGSLERPCTTPFLLTFLPSYFNRVFLTLAITFQKLPNLRQSIQPEHSLFTNSKRWKSPLMNVVAPAGAAESRRNSQVQRSFRKWWKKVTNKNQPAPYPGHMAPRNQSESLSMCRQHLTRQFVLLPILTIHRIIFLIPLLYRTWSLWCCASTIHSIRPS
jgi:hypothetical protein